MRYLSIYAGNRRGLPILEDSRVVFLMQHTQRAPNELEGSFSVLRLKHALCLFKHGVPTEQNTAAVYRSVGFTSEGPAFRGHDPGVPTMV